MVTNDILNRAKQNGIRVTPLILRIRGVEENKLNPYFLTGFTEGEGSFGLYFQKNSKYRSGYQVKLDFTISVHEKDRAILEDINLYFNSVGKIYKQGDQAFKYKVSSIKGLAMILEHFDKYPLITHKQADYLLFKRAVQILQQKKHLAPPLLWRESVSEILSIKASMNLGLSEELKIAFPNIIPVLRPLVQPSIIPFSPLFKYRGSGNWLAGFVSAAP